MYSLYQVDAFADTVFHGNPACVVPLETWLSDDILLKIAQENAVSETAFFVDNGDCIHLRWFTPDIEIDLCGHATLAAAFVLNSILKYSSDKIRFHTMSGELQVTYQGGVYFLDFPCRAPNPAFLPKEIELALNIQPVEVYKSRDYLLVYKDEQEVRDIRINRQEFDKINLGYGGVIVTAQSNTSDFVSRFFTPQATILEDPVTGSAHCSLVPFWSGRLKKIELEALQLSERGGRLVCRYMQDRVLIGGQAVLYSKGTFYLD